MKPSIGIAAKISEALDVSLDYLVGISSEIVKDKKMINRLEDIKNSQKKNVKKSSTTLISSSVI